MNKWLFRVITFTKKALSTLIGLGITLLSFVALSNSVYAQGPIDVLEEIQINSVDDWGSQDISDNVVVFDVNGGIFGYNLTSAVGFPIATPSDFPTSPNISGDTIVWMDQRAGNWDIYGYDLGSGDEFQITTHPAPQRLPAIDGRIVIWADERNGNNIYGYDLINKTEFQVTNHSAPVACPAVSGHIVVWADQRSGSWDIYSKNLLSGVETQLTHTGASSPYCPAISNDIVVVGQDNSVVGINLTGTLIFETTTLYYPLYGRPAVDNNIVVWQEKFDVAVCLNYPCPSTIVGYDIKSGHKFIIPQGIHEAWYPAISGDVVVWRDYDSSFSTIPSPSSTGVYASKLLRTSEFQSNVTSVLPGDPVTYTITLADATITGTMRSVTNPIPPSVTLDLASLGASSGNYDYNPTERVIIWAGSVTSANPVTITYRVQVSPTISFGEYITNTITIQDQTSIYDNSVTTLVARQTYLPVIVHNGY